MYQVIDNVKEQGLETIIDDIQREATLEGNDAMPKEKYDVRTTEGIPLLLMWDNEPAGMIHLEPSHYTGDPDIAVRACRYHILKKYRNNALGFPMLKSLIKNAKKMDRKILWFSQSIKSKALNAIYQHKTKVPHLSKTLYDSDSWQSLELDKRLLFQVDPRSTFLQFVYYVRLTPEQDFTWLPKINMIWQEHNGTYESVRKIK